MRVGNLGSRAGCLGVVWLVESHGKKRVKFDSVVKLMGAIAATLSCKVIIFRQRKGCVHWGR